MHKGKINSWSLQPRGDGMCVCGLAQDNPDPQWPDGQVIRTSVVRNHQLEGDKITVITNSGNEYLLGTVDPDYEAAYPDAKQRLLTHMQKLDKSLLLLKPSDA